MGNWLGYTNPVYYAHKKDKKEKRKERWAERKEQRAKDSASARQHNAGLSGGNGAALLGAPSASPGTTALVRGV